ncbi:hypothetical protein DFH07DRAFT_801357 [Mycena maculata]|uniref:F-box domain-containing protein n=1 Tax=Mycena maculata TaxID=230809 RepID=A0AAD7K1B1_9AGAR|nr:hypothetical protein DFH07DRAFT_801357 [Mycena maculata]
MVLTRRMITQWLPNELITEIVRAAPKAGQAALCRVSKLFHDLALPVLNRAVDFHVDDNNECNFIPCCSALIATPTRADAIRSLTFFILKIWDDKWAKEALDVLKQAMKLMSRLEHLAIVSPSSMTPWRSLPFPRLLSCRLTLWAFDTPGEEMVSSFLTRHPTLTHICMALISTSLQISLPNLQCFEGYAFGVPLIVSEPLRAARLLWSRSRNQNFDNIIMALNSMTDPFRPFGSSHQCTKQECASIFASLSGQMPHTTTLQFVLDDVTVTVKVTSCSTSPGSVTSCISLWIPLTPSNETRNATGSRCRPGPRPVRLYEPVLFSTAVEKTRWDMAGIPHRRFSGSSWAFRFL